MEEQAHGPGLTNDVDIIARRVNSGMLQHGLDQTNPNKETKGAGSDSTCGSFDEKRLEDALAKSGSVFYSRQEWLKRKLKDDRGLDLLSKENRVVLIDTSSLIGVSSTKEAAHAKKRVDDAIRKDVDRRERASGAVDARKLLSRCALVSPALFRPRNPAWSMFHGALKDQRVVAWGPMSADAARFNRAHRLVAAALRPRSGAWMYVGRVWGATYSRDGKAWFFARSCPLSVEELERGTLMYAPRDRRKQTGKRKRSRHRDPMPLNVRGVKSLLHRFYPPELAEDWEKRQTPWHETRCALVFLLFNLLRWIEAQPPAVAPHAIVMVPGTRQGWAADAVTKHHEPVFDYAETDLQERSRPMDAPQEHEWYLAQQMRFVQKRLEDALAHWKPQWTAEMRAWKARVGKLAARSGKLRDGTLAKYVKFIEQRLDQETKNLADVERKWVHWMVHRGFMLKDPEIALRLPMGYFNRVEGLYYDDGSTLD